MIKQLFKAERLSRTAVKDSIDNLPTGLCFSDRRGLLILINRSMIRLAHAIIGKDIQDAEAFWQVASAGTLAEGVERLQYGATPVLRLPDKTVWAFSRSTVTLAGKPVTQLIASDITELDDARLRLDEANGRLKAMNSRLRQYGKDLVEVTAQEERLATKVRIHDELGSVLLATRRCLLENGGEKAAEPILELWRRDISVLRGSAEATTPTPAMSVANAAKALGVVLRFEGELPPDKRAQELLLSAVGEALNNAVRHAGAKSLTVYLSQTGQCLSARITNDGTPPEGEISEGGGLTALRRSLELCGGTLSIDTAPIFCMRITLPVWKEVSSK